MVAGLPGTGVGGLFYVLLILVMPLRELWLGLRGRRGREARWRVIGLLTAIAVAVVAILAAEGWALRALSGLFGRLGLAAGPAPASVGPGLDVVVGGVAPALGLVPPAVLALLWLGIHAVRLALGGAPPAPAGLPPIPLAPPAEQRRVRR